MKAAFVPIELLDVLEEFERPPVQQDDDVLRRSIEAGSIQQPLAVLERDGGRYLVVRGTRRRRIAKELGLPKVPVAIFETPKGETPEEYAPRLRLILELRQDLTPSQRASLIERIKSQYKMTNKAVAKYLGVDEDSITNWLVVRKYVPEIVEALDNESLTMQAARVFDGMNEKGQRAVWKALAPRLTEPGAGYSRNELRAEFSPEEYPEYYVNPEKMTRRAVRRSGKSKASTSKASFTSEEKRRLIKSFEFQQDELDAAKDELKMFNQQITAAAPILAAVIRNRNLWRLVPEDMKPEIERFAELYIS